MALMNKLRLFQHKHQKKNAGNSVLLENDYTYVNNDYCSNYSLTILVFCARILPMMKTKSDTNRTLSSSQTSQHIIQQDSIGTHRGIGSLPAVRDYC